MSSTPGSGVPRTGPRRLKHLLGSPWGGSRGNNNSLCLESNKEPEYYAIANE